MPLKLTSKIKIDVKIDVKKKNVKLKFDAQNERQFSFKSQLKSYFLHILQQVSESLFIIVALFDVFYHCVFQEFSRSQFSLKFQHMKHLGAVGDDYLAYFCVGHAQSQSFFVQDIESIGTHSSIKQGEWGFFIVYYLLILRSVFLSFHLPLFCL